MMAQRQSLNTVADTLKWLEKHNVEALTVDSRQVKALAAQGAVGFVAWPGSATDGRAYVGQALADGAKVAVVEAEGLEAMAQALDDSNNQWVGVRGLKSLLPELAHQFNGKPSHQLEVIAVTGTNGKTSTSWWTAQALSSCGKPSGVIGTLGVGLPNQTDCLSTGLTTPDPVTLNATFKHFLHQGLRAAAIEASSIGIEENRLDAVHIKVAQFTNFTQDHLDYHGDMESYWCAKAKLFKWPGLQAAVINIDDAKGNALCHECTQQGVSVWSYSIHGTARLQATHVKVHAQGMSFQLQERDISLQNVIATVQVQVPLLGEFNLANVLCVIGALRALEVSLAEVPNACAGLTPPAGRMQQVVVDATNTRTASGLPLVFVDYAHTPDALSKALLALRPVAEARGGKLWCVFGCGGNRDAVKRPLMGAVADQDADEIVLTNDNPRNEEPSAILAQILSGIGRENHLQTIEDRYQAISYAVLQSGPNDVVLLAGKGHETTQEILGQKLAFSDVQISLQLLQDRGARCIKKS